MVGCPRPRSGRQLGRERIRLAFGVDLLGGDLLVAPVVEPGADRPEAYLLTGDWVDVARHVVGGAP